MKITIINNKDGTYFVGVISKFGCEDSTCKSWQEVATILTQIKEEEV